MIIDSAGPNRWSASQRACLAEMGFRYWQHHSHEVVSSEAAVAAGSIWLWPAVNPEGEINLVFVLAHGQPTPAVRRLLSDIARHFSLALPANPQPVADVDLPSAALILGFDDAAECLAGQVTLPSLNALLEADVTLRRACWQRLSPLIARHAQGIEP